MNITKEGEGLTAVLKLTIGQEDYAERVESTLKDYRKKAKIDGFRPGTVPMGMVKKMYGQYVLVDEVNKLLSENLQKYIREQDLRILGEPLPNNDLQKAIDWEKDAEFEFVFDIALAPEIELSISKKTKLEYFKIVADNEMIDKQVESFTSRFGMQETVDVIEGTEYVRATITQVGVDEPFVKENASLLLSRIALEADADLFKGVKIGEKVRCNLLKIFENETEVSSMLGIDKEQKDLISSDFEIEITEILRFTKSEINQELFDKVYGEGIVSSEKEMRQKIKDDAEKQLGVNGDYKFFYDIRKKLVDTQKFDLPEAFLKRWLLETNKDNDKVTPEQIEKEFPLFLEDLRWQIISGKIIQDNNIQVKEEDIKHAAKEYTRAQFAQFGMMNPSDEDLEKWSGEILKNREELQKIFENEQQAKLTEFLKEAVKLDEKEVSLEEFKKLVEQN